MKINSCSARLELYSKDITHESKIHKKSQTSHFSHLQGSCIGSRKWLFQERFHCFAASPVGTGISSTTWNIPVIELRQWLKGTKQRSGLLQKHWGTNVWTSWFCTCYKLHTEIKTSIAACSLQLVHPLEDFQEHSAALCNDRTAWQWHWFCSPAVCCSSF